MIIKILAIDILEDNYTDTRNCAVGKAVRRKIDKYAFISVGPESVTIDNIDYVFSNQAEIRLNRMYAFVNPKRWIRTRSKYDALEPEDFEIELTKKY